MTHRYKDEERWAKVEKKTVSVVRQDHYIGQPSIWEAWNYVGHRCANSRTFAGLMAALRHKPYKFTRNKHGVVVPLDDLSEGMARKTSER